MFVYQRTYTLLDLKEDKSAEYIIASKSKGLFKSRLHPLYNAFLYNVKRFEYKIGIQFNNTTLNVEQNNYAAKILNGYIVYALDYWPRNLLHKFVLKNCFLQVI